MHVKVAHVLITNFHSKKLPNDSDLNGGSRNEEDISFTHLTKSSKNVCRPTRYLVFKGLKEMFVTDTCIALWFYFSSAYSGQILIYS